MHAEDARCSGRNRRPVNSLVTGVSARRDRVQKHPRDLSHTLPTPAFWLIRHTAYLLGRRMISRRVPSGARAEPRLSPGAVTKPREFWRQGSISCGVERGTCCIVLCTCRITLADAPGLIRFNPSAISSAYRSHPWLYRPEQLRDRDCRTGLLFRSVKLFMRTGRPSILGSLVLASFSFHFSRAVAIPCYGFAQNIVGLQVPVWPTSPNTPRSDPGNLTVYPVSSSGIVPCLYNRPTTSIDAFRHSGFIISFIKVASWRNRYLVVAVHPDRSAVTQSDPRQSFAHWCVCIHRVTVT